MNNISSFCNSLKNKYPNTNSVLEQIEEIRDTLHIKTEEYQSGGVPYNEAVNKAIESLGDLDDLFESLSKNETLIYFRYALIIANIISGTIVGIIMFLYGKFLGLSFSELKISAIIFFFILLSILAFIVFYNFSELKKPTLLTNYYNLFKKNLIISLSIWGFYSTAVLFAEYKFGIIFYSAFGVIGFFNWPLSVVATWALIKSKIFNFKA